MTIETEIATYPTFQILIATTQYDDTIELDGPDAWALYKILEEFIASPKTKFPEAILAFEFDEGFAGEDPMPNHAWRASLFSPCCGVDVEGVYVEQQTVFLDVEEVHDGTVGLDSGDGEGDTRIFVCARCNLGVSLPDYLDPSWI